jgi:uncharacterized protein
VQNDDRYVVALRPISTPLPLTFSGLLIGSLILSAYELHWIPRSEQAATGFMLLALPLPLHLVASVFGFLARSAAAATGSAVLAAAWLAIALDLVHPTSTGSGPSAAVGMMCAAAAVALVVPAVTEVAVGSFLPAVILTLAALRFVATAVSGLAHETAWAHVSGWAGIVVAAGAFYGALALEIEGTTNHAVLPTLRRRSAKSAVSAPLQAQLHELEHAPGVRRVL